MSPLDDDMDVWRIPDERLLAGEFVPDEPDLSLFVATLRSTADVEAPAASAELLALFTQPAPTRHRASARVALRRTGAIAGVSVALKVALASGVAAVTLVGTATVDGVPAAVQRPAQAVVGVVIGAWDEITGSGGAAPAAPDPAPGPVGPVCSVDCGNVDDARAPADVADGSTSSESVERWRQHDDGAWSGSVDRQWAHTSVPRGEQPRSLTGDRTGGATGDVDRWASGLDGGGARTGGDRTAGDPGTGGDGDTRQGGRPGGDDGGGAWDGGTGQGGGAGTDGPAGGGNGGTTQPGTDGGSGVGPGGGGSDGGGYGGGGSDGGSSGSGSVGGGRTGGRG